MTTDSNPTEADSPSSSSSEAERTERLETRLARLEAQVRALQEHQADLGKGERSRRQSALLFRLVLLAVLLGLFFLVQFRGSP